MPCYSCSGEFGFLRKEIGCEVCGFSFCSRCCKKREAPPKLVKQFVCNKCFHNLTSSECKTGKTSPPLAHKKRMASLRAFSVDSGSQIPSLPSQWSSDKDKDIAERLQRLKKDRQKDVVPSEEDIAERLAILKGIEPSKYKAPPIEVYRPPDIRTSIEQAADLMKQIALEAELDSRLVKPEDEIAERLARLRDKTPEKVDNNPEKSFPSDFEIKGQPSEEMDIEEANVQFQKEHASTYEGASKDMQNLTDDPEYKKLMMEIEKEKGNVEGSCQDDEEEEANKLVEKLLATDIDVEELESFDDTEESNSKSEKDTEEFSWCVICTEDAKIRCFDCDSDIYCLRCFKECHDTLEIKDHKTCPYLQVKSAAS